ncbi:MAG: hypothetical protein QOF57_2131 [Frankiaceae bacterium]|nr:hypothetical protein [Frankiaceae bacterium]
MIPYAAYLRVYEPLAAFADPARRAWAAYAEDAPDRAAALAAEHELSRTTLLAAPPVVTSAPVEAYVLHRAGETFICPAQLDVRSWQALGEFRSSMPDQVADAFVPRQAAERAAEHLEKWYVDEPQPRVHIRTSTWHVPPPWFSPFEQDEREMYLGGPDGPGQRRCVYRTRMSPARRRTAKTLAVVRRTFGVGDATADLEDVGRWLEEFHPHSWVELDYGGLVSLLSDESLKDDRSAELLSSSVALLADGEVDTAMSVFSTVVNWWRRVQGLEHAN